jgi:hypothetical protein
MVKFTPLSSPISAKFELTILILYPIPADWPAGIVTTIDPLVEVLDSVPIVVGDVNDPLALLN